MKSKKILIIAVLLMIVGLSNHAFAAPGWYNCTVERVGTDAAGRSFVWLKDVAGAWGPLWFQLYPPVAKEQLAIGITAQINNSQVQVNVDPSAEYSYVNNMYLLK